jgi:[ribosomal protein S18]-alanine N-acetyltransferase
VISDLQIKLASLADAAAIAGMSRSEIEYGLPWGWTAERVARVMRDPTVNVAVVRRSSGFAAFGIMKYGDDRAHLALFAVHAAHRRAGVGSVLLAWLEDVARVAGIATITAEARIDNANGMAFYEHHGFVQTARVAHMYHGKLDGVRLVKRLAVEVSQI